jgi:conjugative relaxase-like TrwC/TraI family protein
MLRIVQNTSAGGAKSYYSTADYYTEGQELEGVWRGQGAARLGLTGKVEQLAWDALCDNRDPATGVTLTSRQKRERRVGYDFNFHVPKSVSLLYNATRDDRILGAFRASVDETMRDMESEMKTRVRSGGRNEDRSTGNMVWGEFIHFTSRPVDGIPDPHLHAHCFVFNTTFDDEEQRWKAGQFAGLKQDAPYFEGVFHVRLAQRLADLGLSIERTRTGWEVAGVPHTALTKFSRRTALIEAEARAKGVTNAHDKAELGAKTRERKQKNLSLDDLRQEWSARLSEDERSALDRVGQQLGGERIIHDATAAGESVERAIEHCFERKSVVPQRQVLAVALKRAVGQSSVEAVEDSFRARDVVTAVRDGRKMVTTRTVLEEEKRMIDYAREGRGTCKALAGGQHVFRDARLNEGQRRAVLHVLTSPDKVIMIRGAAGVGKTTTMRETVDAIEKEGKHVFTFAPSADASRGVLRSEGFSDAETVARLLADRNLQEQTRGQVIWIDEAGLLGTRTLRQVFDLADALDARVILSGDRQQHGSVERGAALRLLETEAGLVPAEIKDIQRQKGSYKQAVQALSDGHTEDGFRHLDELGWIQEVSETERYKRLAGDYVASVADGKTALVVSPTHLEGEWITDQIRAALRNAGKLGQEQHIVHALVNAHLTASQRSDAANYAPGDVVVFHQNAKGFRKGQRIVAGIGDLPLAQADKFDVFQPVTMSISPGDVLRITRNGETADGHRLNNGSLHTVKGFASNGDIRLENGWCIPLDYGHLAYGYVVTSHASQGKTVDRVFIGQSSESFPASSREQFYVSVSRARERATIYTDDKAALLEAVSHSDERLSATELTSAQKRRALHLRIDNHEQQRREVSHEYSAYEQQHERSLHVR